MQPQSKTLISQIGLGLSLLSLALSILWNINSKKSTTDLLQKQEQTIKKLQDQNHLSQANNRQLTALNQSLKSSLKIAEATSLELKNSISREIMPNFHISNKSKNVSEGTRRLTLKNTGGITMSLAYNLNDKIPIWQKFSDGITAPYQMVIPPNETVSLTLPNLKPRIFFQLRFEDQEERLYLQNFQGNWPRIHSDVPILQTMNP